MAKKFEVFDYSKARLIEILSGVSDARKEEVENKSHTNYFDGYLTHHQAKTIVTEYEYVDKDYLEDYAAYYVRSFHQYNRLCCRVHFFSQAFKEDHLQQLLKGKYTELTPDSAQNNYLGFIVVKPLPKTIIGRTCLKIYHAEGQRFFPIIRKYKANLFGIGLTVDSVAYQEQDSTVAACASSAIWSVFHCTGILFQHSIHSPVEITKAATVHFPYANRHFPNKGLTPEQMAHAIRNVGLEPFLMSSKSFDSLTSNVYGYLKGKIPLIFGLQLHETKGGISKKVIGNHAVAVTGYNLGGKPQPVKNTDFYLKSSRIDKLYVHDDQVGAFARMNIDNKTVNNAFSLSSDFNGQPDVRATPDILIAPLYHKIRIPYNEILKIIYTLDFYIKDTAKKNELPLPQFEWNIFLSDISDFKSSIYQTTPLNEDYKHEILTTQLPRYLWRAICEVDNAAKIEFLFDATDIEQGKVFHRYIEYEPSVSHIFKTVASGAKVETIDHPHLRRILEELRIKKS